MRKFNYKALLEYHSKEVIASLYWTTQEAVCVDPSGKEVNWLDKKSEDKWKSLWIIKEYYPYTTRTYVDHNKEVSEFNFSIGGIGEEDTCGLARLIYNVWFGYVDHKYHKADNKTALKLQNRITGKVVYMGWYDGRFTVTEIPADPDPDFLAEPIPLYED